MTATVTVIVIVIVIVTATMATKEPEMHLSSLILTNSRTVLGVFFVVNVA